MANQRLLAKPEVDGSTAGHDTLRPYDCNADKIHTYARRGRVFPDVFARSPA
ncbi:MAG: hypothetical protein ABSA96_06105 [Candidatus Acidiferrales bacterium]